MCPVPRPGATSADFSKPDDVAALLRQARALSRLDAAGLKLMQGKKLALVSPRPGDRDEGEFVEAAQALGAHVSFVSLGLDEGSSAEQIAATAGLLARLYDAVECQHLPATLVGRIASSTTVPVFAGLATNEHPTAALAEFLGEGTTPAARRRSILQAALLLSVQ